MFPLFKQLCLAGLLSEVYMEYESQADSGGAAGSVFDGEAGEFLSTDEFPLSRFSPDHSKLSKQGMIFPL